MKIFLDVIDDYYVIDLLPFGSPVDTMNIGETDELTKSFTLKQPFSFFSKHVGTIQVKMIVITENILY